MTCYSKKLCWYVAHCVATSPGAARGDGYLPEHGGLPGRLHRGHQQVNAVFRSREIFRPEPV